MDCRKKKGLSHVGMTISFVVFVGFLIFMFFILSPSIKVGTGEKEHILSSLKEKIIESAVSEVTVSSIRVKALEEGGPEFERKNCFSFQSVAAGKVIARNSASQISAYTQGGRTYLIDPDIENRDLYHIYYSKDFSETGSGGDCIGLSPDQYVFGIVKEREFILKEKLQDLKNSYEEEYGTLKENFGIPPSTDFQFALLDQDKSEIISVKKSRSSSLDIYSERIPIQYMDEHGLIKSGWLDVQVW